LKRRSAGNCKNKPNMSSLIVIREEMAFLESRVKSALGKNLLTKINQSNHEKGWTKIDDDILTREHKKGTLTFSY
jgi:hypothetical protein